MDDVRNDFPVLKNNPGLAYLDSAASSLRPQSVIKAMDEYYTHYSANVHRGIHHLSEHATEKFENAREKIAAFIGSPTSRQIIFTRNATDSSNMVWRGWASKFLGKKSRILITMMEHHAHFVPALEFCKETGAILDIAPLTQDFRLDESKFLEALEKKPDFVVLIHASNVLGTINNVRPLIEAAHRAGAVVMLDMSQSVPHLAVDVRALDPDFAFFSGHKMLAPSGIGVLWVKEKYLEQLSPVTYGGSMIAQVHSDEFMLNDPPLRFEAGTPPIAEVIGLGAAVEYMAKIGWDAFEKHESEIIAYTLASLKKLPAVRIFGPANTEERLGVFALHVKGVPAHDVASILDEHNVALRAGFHCAQPVHEAYKAGPSVRASTHIYTTKTDIDLLIMGLMKAQQVFK